MAATETPMTLDEFVDGVRARRVAAGKPPHIDDPVVYNILDGIMAGRATTSDGDRAARRHRATQRSQGRIPYSDAD